MSSPGNNGAPFIKGQPYATQVASGVTNMAMNYGELCTLGSAGMSCSGDKPLRWTTVDPSGFRVAVDHGWVTLEGEAGCEFERCIVENVIRPLPGVTGVTNQVAVGHDSWQP